MASARSTTTAFSGRSLRHFLDRQRSPEDESISDSHRKTKNSAFQTLWSKVWEQLVRMFAFPFLSPPPICFHRQVPDENEPLRSETYQHAKVVEDMVNFDSDATRELYAKILEQRKELTATKDRYRSEDVDVSKFPGWNSLDIDRQRATFEVFDISGDGLVDFEEFCVILTQFGDKTLQDIRYKHFSSVEIDEVGSIGFDEFLLIVHRLTVGTVDASDQSLSDTMKRIDSNMAIRTKLDVLGQLQGGLF